MRDPEPVPVERNLQLLEKIEQNPQVTQADLARQLGVAVGTVNWSLKRLIKKGYVKVRRMQRKRLLYLITPQGMAEKSRLGVRYLRDSMRLYRDTRTQALQALEEMRRAGYGEVVVEDKGDLGEICRLTCLEQGVQVVRSPLDDALPVIRVEGTRLVLNLPGRE